MSQDTDLLYAVLALQMGFITKDQMVEAGALWASEPKRSLAGILAEKGFLAAEAKAALDALVKAKIKQCGDPEKSLAALPVDEDVRKSLLGLPFGDKAKGTLLELKARPAQPDAVGTVVLTKPREERYTYQEEIGHGGLGRVIGAKDTVLGREVAVKEMIRGTDDATLLKRFLREGEIAGRLMHPNIVPVFDVGVREEGGRKVPYFAMGRIHGRDLKQILHSVEAGEGTARRDFSRPRLLHIFQDVCQAVAYAHAHGVIHRDLKPANVMVGNYGEVYVVDWGLAKVRRQADDPGATVAARKVEAKKDGASGALTMDGEVLGTPAYMPPEQADGRVADIDERSDVYSLGAILYELLAFRPPFEGETALNVIAKVLNEKAAPPSAGVAEMRSTLAQTTRQYAFLEPVAKELDKITLRAMARDKNDRFKSVSDLLAEVKTFMEKENRDTAADLKLSGEVQRFLIPVSPSDFAEYRLFGESISAGEVGGNCFDYVLSPDSKVLLISVASVSGKRISAGFISVMLHAAVRSLSTQYNSTSQILAEVERRICPYLPARRTVSMILVRLEPGQRVVRYSTAGHKGLLIHRAGSRTCETQALHHSALGVECDSPGERMKECEICISEGDQILLYTDGLVGCRNIEGDSFGRKRLRSIFLEHGEEEPDRLVFAVLERISDFVGDTPQTEDVTVVAVQRKPALVGLGQHSPGAAPDGA